MALSKPTVGVNTDYAARIGLLFDAFNNGNYAFPATQVPSADANTLDDFERGTFTPAVGGSATYTTQIGRYVKVGRMTNTWITLVINVLGTGSTTLISGLPYASVSAANDQPGSVGYFASLAVSVIFIAPLVVNNSATIKFNSKAASGTSIDLTSAIFGNSAGVVLHNAYEAAA